MQRVAILSRKDIYDRVVGDLGNSEVTEIQHIKFSHPTFGRAARYMTPKLDRSWWNIVIYERYKQNRLARNTTHISGNRASLNLLAS